LVLEYKSRSNGPPDIVQDKGGDVANFELMIDALHSMMCAIMQELFDMPNTIYHKAKIFLTPFARFDKEFKIQGNLDEGAHATDVNKDESDDNRVEEPAKKKRKSKYKWIDSYNFMCTINLFLVVQEYGPPRLYWEGSGMGEHILQFLKQLWNGFHNGWQQNTLTRVLRQMTLKRLGENT
jgi:hypothetical protein